MFPISSSMSLSPSRRRIQSMKAAPCTLQHGVVDTLLLGQREPWDSNPPLKQWVLINHHCLPKGLRVLMRSYYFFSHHHHPGHTFSMVCHVPTGDQLNLDDDTVGAWGELSPHELLTGLLSLRGEVTKGVSFGFRLGIFEVGKGVYM